MSKQFSTVSSRYGAPMGRATVPVLNTAPRSVRLFAVRLDGGGYDDGGAYWGLRFNGERLYCARDNEGDMQFTDATSREHAAFLLDIPAPALAQPFDYAEWCGRALDSGRLDRDDVIAYRAHCDIVKAEALPDRVVFRVWDRNGQVIALFPDLVETYRGEVRCYEHIGQHGIAHYRTVIELSRPATPEEYEPLRRELESAQYNYRLAIRQRANPRKDRA